MNPDVTLGAPSYSRVAFDMAGALSLRHVGERDLCGSVV